MARVSIYVVYRDGWPEYMGTARQCAEHYGVKVETVRFYATPTKLRRGKAAPDTLRYRALGNSMAVPVMRWIGERIAAVECLYRKEDG